MSNLTNTSNPVDYESDLLEDLRFIPVVSRLIPKEIIITFADEFFNASHPLFDQFNRCLGEIWASNQGDCVSDYRIASIMLKHGFAEVYYYFRLKYQQFIIH